MGIFNVRQFDRLTPANSGIVMSKIIELVPCQMLRSLFEMSLCHSAGCSCDRLFLGQFHCLDTAVSQEIATVPVHAMPRKRLRPYNYGSSQLPAETGLSASV